MAVGAGPASGMAGRRWRCAWVVDGRTAWWCLGQAALCRSRRRCALGSTRLRVALARLSSGGRARVRWWRGRQWRAHGVGGGVRCERLERVRRRARERPVARAGASLARVRRARERASAEGGPSRARRAAWPERGPRRRVPVEGAAGWSRGRRGRVTRAAEEKGRRERGKEREKKRKEKEKWEKEKKKEGREIKGEREREGERVGADRGRGRPRVVSAACDAQAESQTGMGQRKIWVPARFLGVSGSQAEDETRKGSSSTTKQGLARDLFLLDFWDVTNLPHLK